MKKIISLFLSLAMIMSIVAFPDVFAYSENFDFLGDAKLLENNIIELTPLETWKVGGVWYKNKVVSTNGIKIEFSYWAGGGRDNSYGGADGLVLLLANNTYNLGEAGGDLGFVKDDALGIEFDSYPNNSGDPSQKHIAIVKNKASNHLDSISDMRVDDSVWHEVSIIIDGNYVSVMLDGEYILLSEVETSIAEDLYVGIAASTGAGLNRHLIKDFVIRKGEIKSGFDLKKDAWPIRNSHVGFGYSDPYYIPIDIFTDTLGFAAGSFLVSIEGWKIVFGAGGWGGNCFGLSMSSVLNYNGQVDFSDYFENSHGKSINKYGYVGITGDGSDYTFNNERSVVSVIERMQLSQQSFTVGSCKVFSSNNQKKNLSNLINYLNQNDAKPLIMCIQNGLSGHALVIETKYKPIQHTFNGDDRFYAIKVYDCNYPYDSGVLSNPHDSYQHANGRYVFVNPDTGEWYYKVSEKNNLWWADDYSLGILSDLSEATITFYDPSKLDETYLEKKLDVTPVEGKQQIMLSFSSLSIDKEWETVFEADNSQLLSISEDLIYTPTFAYNDDVKCSTNTGSLILDSGEVSINSSENVNAVFLSDNDNMIYADVDGGNNYLVDSSKNKITMNLHKGSKFDVILNNDDGETYSLVRFAGDVEEEGYIVLSLSDENRLSIDTNINKSNVDVTVSATDMQDQVQFVNANIKDFNNQDLKNLEEKHSDLNFDGICDNCGYDATKDCVCSCHKTGFSNFFWTIKLFFWKLLGIKTYQYCSCGKRHW